jgi:glycosyltransferase involved in cell wall biosynthesis
MVLTPERLEVVMVSFEGPDQYSQAGGLGVRARELCRALAAAGAATTLAFVGDPDRPAEEMDRGVRLLRWAQGVSRRHPAGVYQGEEEKIAEVWATLPAALAERIAGPAVAAGKLVVILAEEWQTAALCNVLSDELWRRGLRDRCAMLWNANNVFGFERIDWQSLEYVATLTTVSRYMKHLMRRWDVDPLVIPNGIPEEALAGVDDSAVTLVREAALTPCLSFKIGRYTPDKRWHQAVSAIAELRRSGIPARLVMRGGIEPFGGEVREHARGLGMHIDEWTGRVADPADLAAALRNSDAAIVELRSFLPDPVVTLLYAASDAVLANSGHEPFGLVGLETMAAGGLAFVGASGEEYARPYANAVVVETGDPAEVASALRGLLERPELAARLRRTARRDAAEYTWPRVIDGMLERLRFVCEHQGVRLPS